MLDAESEIPLEEESTTDVEDFINLTGAPAAAVLVLNSTAKSQHATGQQAAGKVFFQHSGDTPLKIQGKTAEIPRIQDSEVKFSRFFTTRKQPPHTPDTPSACSFRLLKLSTPASFPRRHPFGTITARQPPPPR